MTPPIRPKATRLGARAEELPHMPGQMVLSTFICDGANISQRNYSYSMREMEQIRHTLVGERDISLACCAFQIEAYDKALGEANWVIKQRDEEIERLRLESKRLRERFGNAIQSAEFYSASLAGALAALDIAGHPMKQTDCMKLASELLNIARMESP